MVVVVVVVVVAAAGCRWLLLIVDACWWWQQSQQQQQLSAMQFLVLRFCLLRAGQLLCPLGPPAHARAPLHQLELVGAASGDARRLRPAIPAQHREEGDEGELGSWKLGGLGGVDKGYSTA